MAKAVQAIPMVSDGEVRPIEEHPDVQAARERLRQATARRDALLDEVRRLREAAANAAGAGQTGAHVLGLARAGAQWAEGLQAKRRLRELEPQIEEFEYDASVAAAALESARAQARAVVAPILRQRVAEQVRRLVPAVRAAMALADELDGALAASASIDPAFRFAEVAPWPLIRGSFVQQFVERAEAFLNPPPPPSMPADRVLLVCRRTVNVTHDGDLMRDLDGKIMLSNVGLPGSVGSPILAGERFSIRQEAGETLVHLGFAEPAA